MRTCSRRRRCPIRPTLTPLAILLALVALLAQPALAQGLGSVELTPTPAAGSAEPGAKATFRLQARNAHILEQNVAFVAVPPAGWTFNVTPANLTLPAGGSGNVTLEVFVPADAATNATVTIPLEARTYGTELVLARSQVNVTVVAPAPAADGGPAGEITPPSPQVFLAVSSSAGEPGRTVEGLVRIRNEGSGTLTARLSGSGAAGWNPRFLVGDDTQILHPGEGERVVRIYASVPQTAAPGASQRLVVLAQVGEHRFEAAWSVVVVEPAPAPVRDEPAENATDEPAVVTPPATRVEPDLRTAVDVRVLETLLEVAPGASTRGTVRVENTGTTPLSLRLVGRGPVEWPAPVVDRPTLDLAPGERADVSFSLAAPSDAIPSPVGRGTGTLTVTSESGLMRTATFSVMVVPPPPRDESSLTETTGATITDPGEGSDVPVVVVGLAAAFGAVGAGAMVVANRPLREKLVWAAVGLYTRLARPDVLGHEEREKLYKIVESTPGIHFHALQRDLGWNTGTLTYHLRVLEKHGFVVSRRDGLYRRFYLQGSAPRKEVFENQGPSGLRADVLEAITNRHGLSQTDLSLLLGANKQTVNYHVKALERQGLIRLEKKGRETFLYPAGAPSATGAGEAKA